jgi:hypothetical protein
MTMFNFNEEVFSLKTNSIWPLKDLIKDYEDTETQLSEFGSTENTSDNLLKTRQELFSKKERLEIKINNLSKSTQKKSDKIINEMNKINVNEISCSIPSNPGAKHYNVKIVESEGNKRLKIEGEDGIW